MLPFLPYREPKLLDSTDDLVDVLIQKNLKQILLVTDKGIRVLGLTKELENKITKNKIDLSIYDETVSNPTTQNVEDALNIYKNNNWISN